MRTFVRAETRRSARSDQMANSAWKGPVVMEIDGAAASAKYLSNIAERGMLGGDWSASPVKLSDRVEDLRQSVL